MLVMVLLLGEVTVEVEVEVETSHGIPTDVLLLNTDTGPDTLLKKKEKEKKRKGKRGINNWLSTVSRGQVKFPCFTTRTVLARAGVRVLKINEITRTAR